MKKDKNLKEKLTKKILEELYVNQKKTMKDIAKILGVKYSAVHSYINEYKINRKEDPRRLNIDKDILYNLWVIDKKSKDEIMEIVGCCKQTLDKYLKYFDIESKYCNFSDGYICNEYVNNFKSTRQIANETEIPYNRVRDILIKNGIELRNKSACQCVYFENKEDKMDIVSFDFSKLQTQSSLKRRCQHFFKEHIAKPIKKRIGRCEICGEVNNLHAHHIVPQSKILSQIINENNNKSDDELYEIVINDNRFLDINNIKVVCEKCHYTICHPYLKYKVNQQPSNSNIEGSTTIEKVSNDTTK